MSSAPWRIALASAVGTSHASSGSPCQDSAGHTCIDTSEGLVLATAVSDGAGSAAHSDIGSSLAVNTLLRFVREYFEDGGRLADVNSAIASRWIRETAATIDLVALMSGNPSRDYSCTLLAAIIGNECAAFLQVGDGAIVVSHGEDDGWLYVFWPQHGEYANTTNFIQSPDVDSLHEFDLAHHRITEFAIFSDGIENLVLHKAERSVHQGFFREMIRPVRNASGFGLDEQLSDALRRYLASPIVCERTDDDKTLLLATRLYADTGST